MSETQTVVIPLRLVSEANSREHWSKKAKRVQEHRNISRMVLNSTVGKAPKLNHAEVVLTRIAPQPLDDDNNVSSLKAVRDGVADWFSINDRDPRVAWHYCYRKGKPKEYAVEIAIRVSL